MPTTPPEVVSAFKNVSVLVLGDLVLDEYLVGESSRISSEAPVPVVRVASQHAVPGGAANTAANVAALGGRAVVIGVLNPEDMAGRQLRRACDERAIRLAPVPDRRPTTRKVRVLGAQHQLLRIDYEEAHDVDAGVEAQALDAFRRELPQADIVVVSDYAKGFVTARLCLEVIAQTHAAGKPVVIDPRPEHASYYAHCDFLTPNWKESQGLLRRPEAAPTDAEIDRTGQMLAAQLHTNVVLTLGGRGIAFFPRDGGDPFRVAAAAREVFDVSGAGDTVVATFALAHAAGCTRHEAIALANRAAGLVVGKRGTATVTASELLGADDLDASVMNREAVVRNVQVLRSQSRRIATAVGHFVGPPSGYLPALRRARTAADALVVGVFRHSGAASQPRAGGGLDGPADILRALRIVDIVFELDEADVAAFVSAVQPDVHVTVGDGGVTVEEDAGARSSGDEPRGRAGATAGQRGST